MTILGTTNPFFMKVRLSNMVLLIIMDVLTHYAVLLMPVLKALAQCAGVPVLGIINHSERKWVDAGYRLEQDGMHLSSH